MSEREQFEAWAKARYAKNPHFWLRQIDDGGYSCGMADSAWDAWQAATQRSAARIAELEAEVQALRRDAERLDYLQCRGATVELLPGTDGFYPMRFRVGGLHAAVSENIRGAIDTAMAQGEKP